MILETERLILRPLAMEDLEDFYSYAGHREVGARSTWKPHESLEESREILREFVDSGEFFAIQHRQDGILIGVAGLHQDDIRSLGRDRCRELGYGLNYDYWGQGYMTEACRELVAYGFRELGIEILTAATSSGNRASQRVLEKLGLRLDGVLRLAWVNYKGDYRDKYCYSLLREEYGGQEVPNCHSCGQDLDQGAIYPHGYKLKWVDDSSSQPLFQLLNDREAGLDIASGFGSRASLCRKCRRIIVEYKGNRI